MSDFPFFSEPGHPVPEALAARLAPLSERMRYPRGHVLFGSHRTERHIYLIREGLARAFVESDGREVTIWLGQENDVIISAQGYVYGRRGYETMELLEDSVLDRIRLGPLRELLHRDIDACNWARRMIEREFVRTEQRLIFNLAVPAAERYREFVRSRPGLLRRVQLQHIASYLGMTPEHLSRIRAAEREAKG